MLDRIPIRWRLAITSAGLTFAILCTFAVAVGELYVQYARPLSDLEATLRRVRFFLLFGVLGGTALSLLGGAMIARRAMAPIAQLTATAEEIRHTRDPAQRIDVPTTDDEVGQLARTLDEMLRALAASRAELEEVLVRQREFVADASHELRTPLTSVIANLELLADTLDGEQGDAARAALRSSQRMRRLVADPEVIFRGVPFPEEAEALLDDIRTCVEESLARAASEEIREVDLLQQTLHDDLGAFVYDRLRRRPMVLPVVVEV